MSDCCEPTTVFQVGCTYNVQCTFTNAAGALFDPTTAYAFAVDPSGNLTSLTVVRLSLGAYQAAWAPTVAGPWIVRFSDSPSPPAGANVTVSRRINVLGMV